MKWMMLIGAIAIIVLLFSRGTLFSGGYLWQILIGIFVVAHIWMMFKGHGGSDDAHTENKTNGPSAQEPKTRDENNKRNHGGCCH
ncbi:hypothetical protein A2Z10_02695 [Candidatus Azambacteria bacterium RBG_16_47_10]|uniref:DUF2933 domain-containing protein n=1 Tax=Candidatus Azambacteria bacterium RBG_16_47_10 TaxID=1797292 RepID=A0A1F5B0Z6_9BACT|nr:MAG: hypothetical protein A2Z10_02695 [Candidatus Azambacteria bacterium RBG_16_47_10]